VVGALEDVIDGRPQPDGPTPDLARRRFRAPSPQCHASTLTPGVATGDPATPGRED
jgi:hypothetical protein